ncbi:diguanylate phosphodiesterase [Thermocrinis albus DSM 14484]|uniref:Diguanylate phosphodiesterase n=1 Tax=Thermocrinis albus (strain DSM 14484 / JCM 11386 / HI 11/12) TaxID=638303 RepID=D3SL20_THEAH|nr:EAL domain-containing protein [Thermocrinis albus]ADC89450.1 diguanylate phosphodiesterase [Thermocrinis albus DSM 14484]
MESKKLKIFAILEHVVDIKTGELHGYRVLSRLVSKEEEISFEDIPSKETKANAEKSVLNAVCRREPDKPLFINMPFSLSIEDLPIYGVNLVVCIPISLSLVQISKTMSLLKGLGLKVALDDFTTVGYQLKELRLGSFDYVFVDDEFYTNAGSKEIQRVVAFLKGFGSKVCFKRIDSTKKLEIALQAGADLGHGYFFGSETFQVGVLE